MNKVSIVIPIYNAEKYIEKCLTSILNQSYKDIEVIAVNDGSKDGSLKILKEYAAKYNNIKVFDQKNQGSAAARNNGIKHAEGEYLTFVDADDFIDSDYIETLVTNIADNDFIVSGYKSCDSIKTLFTKKPYEDAIWSAFKYIATCGKLYKTDFVKKNNIKFGTKYKIGEDVYFTMNAITRTNKIKTVSYAGYNYFVNTSSLTHTVNQTKETKNNEMISLLQEVDKLIENNEFVHLYRNEISYFYLKTFVFHLEQQRHILNMQEYFLEYKNCFEVIEKISMKYTGKKLKMHWQKEEEFAINLICNLFLLSRKLHIEKVLLFLLQRF
ncbi:MAG: glycosyltransferase family 2 protein [Erysipelotrichales bacterium]|nr:glycosyltransferase family 2 protein [Erysipelotrichales bacterium]